MRWGIALLVGLGLAGCGASEAPPPATTTTTAAASTTPGYVQAEHAQAAFERQFEQQYTRGANKGYLRLSTVRFRTPCHAQGDGKWLCEGWGVEAIGGSDNCFIASATVTERGVEGALETAVNGPQEEGFNVCAEGAKEGQPVGDLNAEG